jgi:hypothetical protein
VFAHDGAKFQREKLTLACVGGRHS